MNVALALLSRLAMAVTVLGLTWGILGWAYGATSMAVVGASIAAVAGAIMLGIEHWGRP